MAPAVMLEVAGSLAQPSHAGVGPESLDSHCGRRGEDPEGTWTDIQHRLLVGSACASSEPELLTALGERALSVVE